MFVGGGSGGRVVGVMMAGLVWELMGMGKGFGCTKDFNTLESILFFA